MQGTEAKYGSSLIKIFTYPDKQLVRQFENLGDNISCVSIIINIYIYIFFFFFFFFFYHRERYSVSPNPLAGPNGGVRAGEGRENKNWRTGMVEKETGGLEGGGLETQL